MRRATCSTNLDRIKVIKPVGLVRRGWQRPDRPLPDGVVGGINGALSRWRIGLWPVPDGLHRAGAGARCTERRKKEERSKEKGERRKEERGKRKEK